MLMNSPRHATSYDNAYQFGCPASFHLSLLERSSDAMQPYFYRFPPPRMVKCAHLRKDLLIWRYTYPLLRVNALPNGGLNGAASQIEFRSRGVSSKVGVGKDLRLPKGSGHF